MPGLILIADREMDYIITLVYYFTTEFQHSEDKYTSRALKQTVIINFHFFNPQNLHSLYVHAHQTGEGN